MVHKTAPVLNHSEPFTTGSYSTFRAMGPTLMLLQNYYSASSKNLLDLNNSDKRAPSARCYIYMKFFFFYINKVCI
jgi:hypothetical protein